MDLKAIGQDILKTAVIGILAITVGYLFGNSEAVQMKNRIVALEKEQVTMQAEISSLKSRLVKRSDFMVCAVRNLDRIYDRMDEKPACPMEVPQ